MDTHNVKNFDPHTLYFVPLGGCQEFGLNLNLYGYAGQWLAVDCGIGFAGDRYPGIDLLLPDTLFLEEQKKNLLGIVVTHAHEDHIGAIPYVWPRLKCPIYCTPFVASFLRRKCSEFEGVKGMVIHEIEPDQKLTIGPFGVGVIGVTHSTPSTISLTLETPVGLVVHGNEWNLDPTPKAAILTNREGFKQAGRKGVLAYVGDSTNAPFHGTSIGEKVVEDTFRDVVRAATGRVCVTMFASNIGRILSIAKVAREMGRQVCLAGRSLQTYVAVAGEHGLLSGLAPFISAREAAALPPQRVLYLVTGSQGERRAVMARVATQDYRDIQLSSGDTAIFSARPIPGNERDISEIKGQLLSGGINVIDVNTHPTIHATGHPYRSEIEEMIDWVRPKILIPIQGERFHLEAQADLARQKQVPHVIVPENGMVIALGEGGPRIDGFVTTGVLAIEPSRVMATDHPALRERRQLNEAGVLSIAVVLGGKGHLVAPVRATSLGLFDLDDPDDRAVLRKIEETVTQTIHKNPSWAAAGLDALSEEVRVVARRVVHAAFGLKPKTMVHVIET